jgi:hypothetical protein
MISTVTTTTVSTVTTTVTTVSFVASLALVSVLTLFVLLLQKELATATESPRLKALGRTLDVAVVPLLMAFAMIVAVRVAEVLR